MSPFDPTIDGPYREYAMLQLRRHLLLTEGKEDDPQTEEIENQMAELWEHLDGTQRQSLSGMASDLNWVRRPGALPPKSKMAEEVTNQDSNEMQSSWDRGEWHAFLHYLRVCAALIPPRRLAHIRGSAYEAIQMVDIARVMKGLAAELEPSMAKGDF